MRHPTQAVVTGLVTVMVVVRLEEIDVDHQQRQGLTRALRARPFLNEGEVEVTAVGEAGQGVGHGQFGQLPIGRLERLRTLAHLHFERRTEGLGGRLGLAQGGIGGFELSRARAQFTVGRAQGFDLPLNGGGHDVEALSQIPKLVRRPHLDAPGVIATRQTAAHLDQFGQRPCEPLHEASPEQRPEDEHHAARQHHARGDPHDLAGDARSLAIRRLADAFNDPRRDLQHLVFVIDLAASQLGEALERSPQHLDVLSDRIGDDLRLDHR